ncbi:MAG TPA: hypothetical protein VN253_00870, partial [Kofleriaceae bacterium]|nr:hypothetical protein [Kofleriaceae bacterium]
MACRCLLVGLAIGLAGCRALLGIEGAVLEPDAADDRAPCVATGARCAGDDVLRTCTGVGQLPTDEACAWGCTTVGAPHCAQLLPEGGVLESTDLLPDPELRLTTISDPVTVNTDDGSILPGIRDGGPGVKNGIRFESRGGVGVFSFGGLVVTGPVSVIGGLGVALVAGGDITVNGVIDLRGDCVGSHAGPGGRPGGGPGTAAAGATGGGGGRAGGNATSGGGGGGWGGDGGTGGKGNALTGGAPGMRQPVLAMMGGGGGGGGG